MKSFRMTAVSASLAGLNGAATGETAVPPVAPASFTATYKDLSLFLNCQPRTKNERSFDSATLRSAVSMQLRRKIGHD